MNIGDRKDVSVVNRYRPQAVRQTPAQTQPEAPIQAKEPSESFVASAVVATPEAKGSQPFSVTGLAKSALDTAAYIVGDLIPSAVGVGYNAVKDTLTGGTRESHFEHKVATGSEAEASQKFEQAKERLLNPNEWKKLGPKWGAASFQVYDAESKKPLDGPPKNGDYLKIGLPDPFKHVWVQIDSIETGDKQAEVRVRPSVDPTSNSQSIAHFFSEETANVFRVRQEGNEVISSVTGENEKLNTKNGIVDRGIQAARLMGAWMGAKKPQWHAFARKMLDGPQPARGLQTSGLETALNASTNALNAGGK